MNPYKKSQISIIDLFSALVIFIIMMIALILFWNQYSSRLDTKLQNEEMYSAAIRSADQLSRTQGIPTAWEENESGIQALGLAKYPNIISKQKLLSLQYLDYDKVRTLLNIKKYNYYLNMKLLGDTLSLMDRNNIRLAYLAFDASKRCTMLEARLSVVLNCNPSINDVDVLDKNNNNILESDERSPCEMYLPGDKNDYLPFFNNNMDDYDIIIFIDPSNDLDVPAFDSWLRKKDHFAFLTMKMSPNGFPTNMFDIEFTRDDSGSKTLTITPEYYANPDKYLLFDGSALNPAKYGPNHGSYTKNKLASDYLEIARYNQVLNDAGMSTWTLGDGKAYYFSDSCACLLDAAGTCTELGNKGEDLATRIVDSIELIIFDIATIPYYIVVESGIYPPEDATVANVRRYVIYENFQDKFNYSAAMDFSLWVKRK